ncbi:MAG: hypothetical protein H8E73_01685 [Planctomycetes bacterium]|nr:hypothetical protein [Planctomycetota bacterium]
MNRNQNDQHVSGDRIQAIIGDNARNVAVGKNVRQIVDVNFAGDDVVVSGHDVAGRNIVKQVPKSVAFESIVAAARITMQQLERDYEQARRQATNWTRASIIAAVVGFVIVLIGAFLSFGSNTTVGIVTSLSGIVPEVAAALFFQQTREANIRVDAYHKDLIEAKGIDQSIQLCTTMEDDGARDRLKEVIIKRILSIKR